MDHSIGSFDGELHPASYAVKEWLSKAIFRMGLYPKALYMPLGVDQSTWSRWTSLEHDQTPPMGMLQAILALLDKQAEIDLINAIRPQRSQSGRHAVVVPKAKARKRLRA